MQNPKMKKKITLYFGGSRIITAAETSGGTFLGFLNVSRQMSGISLDYIMVASLQIISNSSFVVGPNIGRNKILKMKVSLNDLRRNFYLRNFFAFICLYRERLRGLVVRVLGYRSGGPGSIPGNTRKKK
jgi:hypothetical protein